MQNETRRYNVDVDSVRMSEYESVPGNGLDAIIVKGNILNENAQKEGRFFNVVYYKTGRVQQTLDLPIESLRDEKLMNEIAQKCEIAYELCKK